MSSDSTLALVESPAQLLNVIELAHHAARTTGEDAIDLGELRIAVLAPSQGRSREQLRAVVALARQEGLSVSWHEPRSGGASVARTIRGLLTELGRSRRLVVGDPFSGVLQVLIGLVRPSEVVVVDDGTATLEFVRQWAAGEALHRWHQPFVEVRPGVTGAARQQIAANLRRRLGPEAGTRLRLFTCMPLADAGLESAGVGVSSNTYAWLQGRFGHPDVLDGVDLIGTSLVESGVVARRRLPGGGGPSRRGPRRDALPGAPPRVRRQARPHPRPRRRGGPAHPAAGDRGASRTGQRDPHQLSLHRRPHAAGRARRHPGRDPGVRGAGQLVRPRGRTRRPRPSCGA